MNNKLNAYRPEFKIYNCSDKLYGPCEWISSGRFSLTSYGVNIENIYIAADTIYSASATWSLKLSYYNGQISKIAHF